MDDRLGRARDDLVELAKRGDSRAIDALLAPYLPRLHKFLRRQLHPALAQRESAADLLQSTCREVLADLPRFDSHGEGEAAFRRWLFTCTVRKLRDRQRFHRRQKRDIGQEELRLGDTGVDVARSTVTPSGHVMAAENRARVLAALDKLPDAWRDVVRMIHLEGMSVAEVAARFGKTTTAVHSLMARALARLARLLED